MKLRLAAAAALVAATTSSIAGAQQPMQQPWIRNRGFGEGIGIRTGNLEFHPSLALEVGYDSNYFQRAGGNDPLTPDESPVIDMYRIRPTASFTVSTLRTRRMGLGGATTAPSLQFDAGANIAYNILIPADSSNDVPNQNHVATGVDFALLVLPERPFSWDLYGDYLRTVEPNNTPSVESAFDRDTVRLGTGLNFKPGGGLFDWRVGYEVMLHLFEHQQFQLDNNIQHAITTRGRWRFFPRTAFLYDGEYRIIRFSNTTTQNDGETIQARLGLNGLVTYHFALLAMGGWASSYFRDNGPIQRRNYDSFVAQAEAKFFLMARPELTGSDTVPPGISSIAVGYVRNFQVSYLGAYYQRDRVYAPFTMFIGPVVGGLEVGLSHYTFPDSFFRTGALRYPGFTENRIDAQLFGEYRLTETVGINATIRYDQNITDAKRVPIDPAGTQYDNLEFARWQAWLGVRWFM